MVSEEVKVLIPAAGLGKRTAGLAGGGHKELLRVGKLTMLEHCLGMVLDSGISQIGLVIRQGKEELADQAGLYLEKRKNSKAGLTLLYQNEPRGLADAMSLAVDFAGKDPLAVMLPDNLLLNGPPALEQMLRVFYNSRENTIGAMPITASKTHLFGNVGFIRLEGNGSLKVAELSPKLQGTANLRTEVDYYKSLIGAIYLPGWAERLKHLTPNWQGELDDTGLIIGLVAESKLQAAILSGEGFDLGHPAGLEAARTAWKESCDIAP